DGNFVIDAAPLPIAPRITECPVSVDEPENDLARLGITAEQAVAMMEDIGKDFKFLAESIGGIVVVMQMNVEIAIPRLNQDAQSIDVFRSIFILRKKEGMPRRATARIPELIEPPRILSDPGFDAGQRGRGVCFARFRFKV